MFIRYAFLADAAFLDATGKMNASGIFDVIRAIKFPAVQRDMTLIVYLEGTLSEKGEHKLSVELRDEKANKLASFDQIIALSQTVIKSALRAGVMVKLQDMQFQTAGEYEFVMFINDRFLGRVTFVVQKIHVKEAGEA